MKTTLKFLALFLAAALPTALAADTFGLALPVALEATHLLAAFAATLVVLIAFSDYGRAAARRHYLASLARSTPRATHPLAA